MKKFFTKKSNLITLVILLLFIWRQTPLFMKNFQNEGVKLNPQLHEVIFSPDGLTEIQFPPLDAKVITIFWATWCGPCKVEMARLQNSVKEGKIKSSQIIAIDPFEDQATVKNFLAKEPYDFTFIHAPKVVHALKIEVTPTTLFVDRGEITQMSSGMSLIGIWRAELFLK